MAEEKPLSIREVANRLGVTTRAVMTYIEAGAFPNAFKTSPAANAPWRIPVSDVEAYIKRQRLQPPK